MLLNVLDYPDAKSTIDAASDGDRVYFPGGRIYEAPKEGWQITKSLEIFGDGPSNPAVGPGTILTSSSQDPGAGKYNDVLVIDTLPRTEIPHIYIHDLTITRPAGSAPAIRDGIRWFRPPVPGPPFSKIGQIRLERLNVLNMGEVGVHLHGANGGPDAVVGFWMLNCNMEGCGHQGLYLRFATAGMIVQSRFASNGMEGCFAEFAAVALFNSVIETNRTGGIGLKGLADLTIVGAPRIDACRFIACTNGEAAAPARACYMFNVQGGGYISPDYSRRVANEKTSAW